MNNKIIFAVDTNFEFVKNDNVWQQFFKKFNVSLVDYTDMNKLTHDMEKNTISLSYLPTACYFYFKADPFYTPFANALFTTNQTSKIGSLLIVGKNSQINSISELEGKSLGIIHHFCTTSYFAPAILLRRNNYSIHDFFSRIEEVGAWQLQIDAVINGKVDATMIQEDIWLKLRENAQKTKVIAKVDNLPSPVVLCAKNIGEEVKQELSKVLFVYKPKAPQNSLFNGFIPYQSNQIEAFFSEATKAFEIKTVVH